MDYQYTITFSEDRKSGAHFSPEERGRLEQMIKDGLSKREMARQLHRSPTTISNEIKRGTPLYKGRGRKPLYNARYATRVYQQNRKKCHRPSSFNQDSPFILWMAEQVLRKDWSPDACVGYARKNNLFPQEEIPCTKTLYNMLHRNELPYSKFDLPEVLKRKKRATHLTPQHKHSYGRSIDERPEVINNRQSFGHWEGDTVIGRKGKHESAIFTLVERTLGYYIALKIPEKSSLGICEGLERLKEYFGSKFNQVFQSITVDNGSEFSELAKLEQENGTAVYYAHPYSAWERGINERHNRMLRRYIPKGKSIDAHSIDDCLEFADKINGIPRKRLDYATPEELFEEELNKIYAC